MFLLKCFLIASVSFALNDPKANSDAIVQVGNARFTVLTTGVVRMEYDSQKQFEDRASVVVINRNLPVPKFDKNVQAKSAVITTSKFTLTYQDDGSEFNKENLHITTCTDATWFPGKVDDGNLFGTIRTLDRNFLLTLNCTETKSQSGYPHCAYGIPSRNGWSLIDDSQSAIMSSDQYWIDKLSPNNTNQADLYFFSFGQDYKQALGDFAKIGGNIPMIPRYMLGTYFTRWYGFDAHNLQTFIARWKRVGLPLDVLILDMNWHVYGRWGGYTWDPILYPDHSATIEWLTSLGLKTAANVPSI